MPEVPAIEGACDARFRAVRDAFADSFRRGGEVGAAVAVTLDGVPVVDLWGGHADLAGTRCWRRDTLVNLYSTTKGLVALCALRLGEQGRLDLDAPVARYWPEFAKAGKDGVLVRWLLTHAAGLPALRETLPPAWLYDQDAMATALAGEAPWWEPGALHGYHALTFGWLIAEVVRRVTGWSLGRFLRDEIAGPIDADLHIGLPEREHRRVAEMSPIPVPSADEACEGPSLFETFTADPDGLAARAFLNPPSIADGPNHGAWRRAEIPGANGHGTARAIARVYGALAQGGSGGSSVLGPETLARARAESVRGPDAVLGIETRFGLGFMLSQARPGAALGPCPAAFGHPGAGGSVGFADPEARLGFGYVMNRMGPHMLFDARSEALVEAVYASL